jgi:hypothetical protein
MRTVDAIIDEHGNVRLLEPVRLSVPRRALVTILKERQPRQVPDTALLGEAVLTQDWNRPEEDDAWAHLQPGR